MIAWIGTLLLTTTVVCAIGSYSPSLLSTLTIWSYLPGVTYDGPWQMVYPASTPAVAANYGPGSYGTGWSAYQVNTTGRASFSVPFYGYGIADLIMALTPSDETQQTVNLTLSLDDTTWIVAANATPAANISSYKSPQPLGPPIDLGPLAMTATPTHRVFNVTVVGSLTATFFLAHATYGFQTEAYVPSPPYSQQSDGVTAQTKYPSLSDPRASH